MLDDFVKHVEGFIKTIGDVFDNLMTDISKTSYISMVECLKFRDDIAVKEAIYGLVSEGNKLSVPPLFLTSQKHPDSTIRAYAKKELYKLDSDNKIRELTENKDLKEAMNNLIGYYGNYKLD